MHRHIENVMPQVLSYFTNYLGYCQIKIAKPSQAMQEYFQPLRIFGFQSPTLASVVADPGKFGFNTIADPNLFIELQIYSKKGKKHR